MIKINCTSRDIFQLSLSEIRPWSPVLQDKANIFVGCFFLGNLMSLVIWYFLSDTLTV